jgi:hypothetical protein
VDVPEVSHSRHFDQSVQGDIQMIDNLLKLDPVGEIQHTCNIIEYSYIHTDDNVADTTEVQIMVV